MNEFKILLNDRIIYTKSDQLKKKTVIIYADQQTS